MKSVQFTGDFSVLDGDIAAIPTPSPSPLRALHDLVRAGLVWHGEYPPVDNLWTTCAHRQAAIPFYIPEIDTALSSGGLACGALHEFYYNDPARNISIPVALPTLLARNAIDSYYASSSSAWSGNGSPRGNSSRAMPAPPFFIAWIGRQGWPTPFTLPQHLLRSCLFIDPPTEKLTLWAIETALCSPLIKLVIATCPRIPLTTTRRLSLRAHTHGTTALLIRAPQDLTMPSSSATKWSLSPLPSAHYNHPLWKLTLERSKGGAYANSSWTIGLGNNYENRETLSLRVLPRVVDTDRKEMRKVKRFG